MRNPFGDVRQMTVDPHASYMRRTVRNVQRLEADFKVEPEVFVIAVVIGRAAELCGGGPPAY